MQAPICHGRRDVYVETVADPSIRVDEDDECRKAVLNPCTPPTA